METTRTGWHRKVETWLDQLGVRYDSEVTDFPPYSADIYLPDSHIILEIDGPQHLLERDKRRDDILCERYGVVVIHFNARKGLIKSATVARIENAILSHTETIEERKSIFVETITG